MPQLSDDDIKGLIANSDVFAISIDTAIFDGKQKTFQNAVLRRLDQFHQRDVRVIFVDIIAEEMKAHLREDAIETQRALKKALRAHNKRWRRAAPNGEIADLLIDADAKAFAEAEFAAFRQHINGDLIAAGETPDAVQKVFDRYFAESPPFGAADKRKSEFPDAFALLRLEELAAEEGRKLMCVSPDNGWLDFTSQSNHLICVARLEDALALFNAADQHVADAIVERWRKGEGGEFLNEISRGFEYRLDDLDFDIDAHADITFEAEPLSAILQHISAETISSPTVIAVDGETVTFTVRVDALIGFDALFNFYVTDSIDRDDVGLGSEEAYVERTLPFELTITADRSLEEGPVFHEVEVAKKRFEVDFGYVEAFPNEDPTHEKY